MSDASTVIGLSVIALILLIPPFIWHTYSRNIPAVILLIWLGLMNIKSIVDTSIWSGSDFATKWDGKIWCDIMGKLQMGANIGISCSVTNIVYNLHYILKAESVLLEWNSWKKITRDLSISLITPIFVMGFSYILQVYRYGIARFNGCQNILSPTWVTTVLYTMWMLIWASIGTLYAIALLYLFYQKRKDVKDILHCTNSGLNLSRFLRLLIFCFLIILVMFPFSVYTFVQDLQNVGTDFDLKSTHSKSSWGLIIKFDPGKPLYNIWLYDLMSYLVFIIFGLGSDALRMYERVLQAMRLGFVVDLVKGIKSKVEKESKVNEILSKIYPNYNSDSNMDEYDLNRTWTKTDTEKSIISDINFQYNSTASTPIEHKATNIFLNKKAIPYQKQFDNRHSPISNEYSFETLAETSDSFISIDKNGQTDFKIHSIGSSSDGSKDSRTDHDGTTSTASSGEINYHYKVERI